MFSTKTKLCLKLKKNEIINMTLVKPQIWWLYFAIKQLTTLKVKLIILNFIYIDTAKSIEEAIGSCDRVAILLTSTDFINEATVLFRFQKVNKIYKHFVVCNFIR